MPSKALDAKRVLVVGASAGIGRAFAVGAVQAGAEVVLCARRALALSAAVDEAGGGVALAGDVSDPEDCKRIVRRAAETLGEIDLVFISVGVSPLAPLADTTVEHWSSVLGTNLVGITQLIGAAIPALAPAALVVAVSSETVGQPRAYLGAYAASKAALEETLLTWRTEHPGLRFACVTVGGTAPTEFAQSFEPELFGQALTEWLERGLIQQEQMPTSELAEVLVGTLGTILAHPAVGVERLVLRSPSPPMRPAPA